MKKAQVTMFAVIGGVIVLASMLFFTFKETVVKRNIETERTQIVEELPNEFLPIQPFMEECLAKTALQGLIVLGERGGYIYAEKLRLDSGASEGDAVKFAQASDLLIPYWYYLSSPNTCRGECAFDTKRLPLKGKDDSVERQLEKYIENNIDYCLNGFEQIKKLGFDVEVKGKQKAETTIKEKEIDVMLTYPIKVKKLDNNFNIDTFATKIELDLNSIYRMADYVTNLERDYRFLEKHAINLMVGFSGMDSEKLPPMSDSSFEIVSKIRWKKSDVKNRMQTILVSYIPFLRILDTPNYADIDTGNNFVDGLYNYAMTLPNNISINNLEVTFNYYDFWDLYFELNCKGELCEPESGFIDLLPIGLQRYNFVYDLSFPVLVEIKDSEAFNGKGYTFKFMLESNIRNNEAMKADFNPLPAINEEANIFCDKLNSGIISISAKDSISGTLVDGVEVLYSCIDSCYVGEMKEGVIETKLPICEGGMLVFKKEGYETKYYEYSSSLDKSDSIRIELKPKKELYFTVKKKMLLRQGDEWSFSNQESDLEDYETAIIAITRNTEFGEEVNYIDVKKGITEPLELSEGLYQIEISIYTDKGYYIPAEKRNVLGKEINIEQLNMSSFITGRTLLNYTFSRDELSKSKVTLYVIASNIYGIPMEERNAEDIIIDYDKFASQYKEELKPRVE